MKKKHLSLLVVLVIAAISICACGKRNTNLVEIGASRTLDDEGDVHYIDDVAIPLAAEAATSKTVGEASATLACINAERVSTGLQPLVWNTALEQTAQVRAQECVQSFSHTRPNGTDWWTVNSEIMYGENLAKNYFDAKSVVDAWMKSPDHRENILKPDFTTVAVAAFEAGDGTWYWAQIFGY